MTKQEKVDLIKKVLGRLTVRMDMGSSAVLYTFDPFSRPSEIGLLQFQGQVGAIHMSELEAIVDEVA
jgi:hypothetical protein